MNRAAVFLLTIGLFQMTADILGIAPLKAIASATLASPAPKVFSAVRGLETYSIGFSVEWRDASGWHSTRIASQDYARIRGPYNRRNIYGAALAYGPILASDPRTLPMFEAVSRHALCGAAPLLHELGRPPGSAVDEARIRIIPARGARVDGLPLLLNVSCR